MQRRDDRDRASRQAYKIDGVIKGKMLWMWTTSGANSASDSRWSAEVLLHSTRAGSVARQRGDVSIPRYAAGRHDLVAARERADDSGRRRHPRRWVRSGDSDCGTTRIFIADPPIGAARSDAAMVVL